MSQFSGSSPIVTKLTKQLVLLIALLLVVPLLAPCNIMADSDNLQIGPLTFGGAMRVNYINGDYVVTGDAPQRGGNGGNFELDTFFINASLNKGPWTGEFQYRWYNGYNMLHTGWLGYDFENTGELQIGVTRVPFGPGPYGVSQSYFFDMHYYLGLSDDMDLGIKYLTSHGNWDLAFAYFISSEPNGNGSSLDSARYGYDIVKWNQTINPDGTVNQDAGGNGYEERNQINARAIYHMDSDLVPTEIGASVLYGQLKGVNEDDGNRLAISGHMVNQFHNFTLATQLTRLNIDISQNNALNSDALIPMGAYDFAWPATTKAWIPAISLSYKKSTPSLPWLNYVIPYIEYSNIIKDDDSFNNSEMFILGAAWASGGWYIYSDLAWSTGNYFIGNIGDDYGNIYDPGVGDFGADGNNRRNFRFNINFGYYF
jgi:hypothetical protein